MKRSLAQEQNPPAKRYKTPKKEEVLSDEELIPLEDVEEIPRKRLDLLVRLPDQSYVTTGCGRELEIVDLIGEGMFGKVFHVQEHRRKFAMKLFKLNLDNLRRIHQHEMLICKTITADPQKNLVRMEKGGVLHTGIENCSPLYLLMELLGPSIYDVMKSASSLCGHHAVFRNYDIARVGKQILAGAQHLEQLKIVHLDLKPENIFCNEQSDVEECLDMLNETYFVRMKKVFVKIGDFGCAKRYDALDPPTTWELLQTQNYRAPEIFLGLPFSPKSDVWSIGCILAEMYTGQLLFYGNTDADTEAVQFAMMKRIVAQAPTPRMWRQAMKSGVRTVYSREDCNMLETAKDVTATRPLRANQRIDDPNVQFFELLSVMFRMDPVARPSFIEASQHPFFHEKIIR